jgi:hypothetical protein
MFVLIDNTDEIRTSFFWREKNQIIRASSRANRPLLVLLEEVLAKRKKKISNLSGRGNRAGKVYGFARGYNHG